MIDRKEFAEEVRLREHIRAAIRVVEKKRQEKILATESVEKELRSIIRELIGEAKKIAVYDSTGKNELNVFLLNSSFRSTLETSYRKLTTSPEQRQSYIEHMVVFVNEFLERLDSLEDDEFAKDEKPEEPEEVEDSIKIDVGGEEEAEGEETIVSLGPDDIKFGDLYSPGSDLTGARAAYSAFVDSKTIIRDAYSNLDNPQDQTDFRDELPRQIILYGKEYEASLQAELGATATGAVADLEASVGAGMPEPMTPDRVAVAGDEEGAAADVAAGAEEEEEIPAIELQEILQHLDIDDIIENLL